MDEITTSTCCNISAVSYLTLPSGTHSFTKRHTVNLIAYLVAPAACFYNPVAY